MRQSRASIRGRSGNFDLWSRRSRGSLRCLWEHEPTHKNQGEYQRGEKAKEAYRFETGLGGGPRGSARNLRHVRFEAFGWGLVRHLQYPTDNLRTASAKSLWETRQSRRRFLTAYCRAGEEKGQPPLEVGLQRRGFRRFSARRRKALILRENSIEVGTMGDTRLVSSARAPALHEG